MNEDVVTECSYGCGWKHTGDADDGVYERRVHEERFHSEDARVQAAPQRIVCRFDGCEEQADVEGFCFYHARHVAAEAPPLAEPEPQPEPETRTEEIVAETQPWTRLRALDAIRAFHEEHGRPPKQVELRLPLPSASYVYKEFGGMSAAVKAAGFEPTSQPRKPRAAAPARPSPAAPEPAAPAAPVKPPPAVEPQSSNGSLASLAAHVDDHRELLLAAQAAVEQAERDLAESITALEEAIATVRPPTPEPAAA